MPVDWPEIVGMIEDLELISEELAAEGFEPVPAELIQAARSLCDHLRASGEQPPHDLYTLPDGHPMLEWKHPDGRIVRIEVEGPGVGERMTSWADDRPAAFERMTW